MLRIFNDNEFVVIAEDQQDAELLVEKFFKKQRMDCSSGKMRRDTDGEFKNFYHYEESTVRAYGERMILGNKNWS